MQTITINVNELIEHLTQTSQKVAISLGPSEDLQISNNRFNGLGIHIDQLSGGSIDGNKAIGRITIPGGNKKLVIDNNTFQATFNSLTEESKKALINALTQPDKTTHKQILRDFFSKVFSELLVREGAELILHTAKGSVPLLLNTLTS